MFKEILVKKHLFQKSVEKEQKRNFPEDSKREGNRKIHKNNLSISRSCCNGKSNIIFQKEMT